MRHIKYIFLSVVFLLVQMNVAHLLTVEGITPDILIIWVVYLSLKEGQTAGTIWGFCIGLAFDIATGGFIGLSALTKTICGFSTGFFYNENKTLITLSSYRFLVAVLVASLIHNSIYFLVYTQGSDIGLARAVLQVGLATTFYTTTWTLLPMLAFARRTIA
jgi:rod shape-determining protein MreD